eukprot:349967-Chlamydomonas_euryale.AAC.4
MWGGGVARGVAGPHDRVAPAWELCRRWTCCMAGFRHGQGAVSVIAWHGTSRHVLHGPQAEASLRHDVVQQRLGLLAERRAIRLAALRRRRGAPRHCGPARRARGVHSRAPWQPRPPLGVPVLAVEGCGPSRCDSCTYTSNFTARLFSGINGPVPFARPDSCASTTASSTADAACGFDLRTRLEADALAGRRVPAAIDRPSSGRCRSYGRVLRGKPTRRLDADVDCSVLPTEARTRPLRAVGRASLAARGAFEVATRRTAPCGALIVAVGVTGWVTELRGVTSLVPPPSRGERNSNRTALCDLRLAAEYAGNVDREGHWLLGLGKVVWTSG